MNSTNIMEYSNDRKARILSLMRYAAVHKQDDEKLSGSRDERRGHKCKRVQGNPILLLSFPCVALPQEALQGSGVGGKDLPTEGLRGALERASLPGAALAWLWGQRWRERRNIFWLMFSRAVGLQLNCRGLG